MSLLDIEKLFYAAGGIGMFLYGMHLMAAGLQKAAGARMKRLMGTWTSHCLAAVLVGIFVTVITQSSSAAAVMTVGFVNAGLMNLEQAAGVIMGANIGTAVTSWVISMLQWHGVMQPGFYAPLLIGIGACIVLCAKKDVKRQAGEMLVGFGLLFLGLDFVSSAVEPYTDVPVLTQICAIPGQYPFIGLIAGLVLSALLQSTSAAVGILQTFALSGLVPLNSAVFLILGMSLGTCVTVLWPAAGARQSAKRAAVFHLLFNASGVCLFAIAAAVIFWQYPQSGTAVTDSVSIALFCSAFYIANTVLFLPLCKPLIRLSGRLVRIRKDSDTQNKSSKHVLRHLNGRIFENPAFAVQNSIAEVIYMGQTTYDNLKRAFDACLSNDETLISQVYQQEETIDRMARQISDELVKISGTSLSGKQQLLIDHLFYTVSDIERMGDHAENLAELAQMKVKNGIRFSPAANKELEGLMEYVTNSVVYALRSRENPSMAMVTKTSDYEEQVDYVESALREAHIERLAAGLCEPRAGVVFLDILTNLERISDHADNIAGYVKKEL